MQLLYSNCVPKLTHGAAIKDLTAAEANQYKKKEKKKKGKKKGKQNWKAPLIFSHH